MARCQICKAIVKLKFETADIAICTRCIKTINDRHTTVPDAELLLRERYKAAVQRGITRQLSEASTIDEVDRLERRLDQLHSIVEQRFSGWLNNLLQEEDIWGGNDLKRAVKFIRAHRRGLIAPHHVFYARPGDWEDRARVIRKRDGYQCNHCGARDTILHVHHIIHLQNSGTNRAANLVTLCFDCHQAQHDYPISVMDGDKFGLDLPTSDDDDSLELLPVTPAPPPQPGTDTKFLAPPKPTSPPAQPEAKDPSQSVSWATWFWITVVILTLISVLVPALNQ